MSDNPYRRKCDLCEGEDDLGKMQRFMGKFYHAKRTKGFTKSCLQAAKDVQKKK